MTGRGRNENLEFNTKTAEFRVVGTHHTMGNLAEYTDLTKFYEHELVMDAISGEIKNLKRGHLTKSAHDDEQLFGDLGVLEGDE